MSTARFIEPPVVGTPLESVITLAVVVPFGVQFFLPNEYQVFLVVPFIFLTLATIYLKAIQPFHLSFFCTLWVCLPLLHPTVSKWPFNKLVPLAVYASVVAAHYRLRRSVLWMRSGRLGKDNIALVLLVVVVSSAALLLWNVTYNPDLSANRAIIAEMAFWLIPLTGVAFALVNAAVEEAIFRGIFLQALDGAVGAGIIALVIQAVIFGWMHYSEMGYPRGLIGVSMAAVYGLLLGLLRYRARGMLSPWLAHVGTDITVFAMVATS